MGDPSAEPWPAGRTYFTYRRVLLADTTPDGRMRLDAISRVLQDAATLDVQDAPIIKKGPWVVRWLEATVYSFPRYLDTLEVETHCSGTGSAWAQRTTTLTVDGAVQVSAVANWVLLDDSGSRPSRLPPEFYGVYGGSAMGRTSNVKLILGEILAGLTMESELLFQPRRSDMDVMGHINNAIHACMVEEALGLELDHLSNIFNYRLEFEHPIDVSSPVSLSILRSTDGVAVAYVQNQLVKARFLLRKGETFVADKIPIT